MLKPKLNVSAAHTPVNPLQKLQNALPISLTKAQRPSVSVQRGIKAPGIFVKGVPVNVNPSFKPVLNPFHVPTRPVGVPFGDV